MLDGGGQLRTRKLDEIAQNIGLVQSAKKQENINIELLQSRKKQGTVLRSKGNKEEESNEASKIQDRSEQQPLLVLPEPSTTNDNGKWTAPLVSEVDGDLILSDGGEVENASDDSDDSNEEYFMPPIQGRVDPAVLASLPPSMQLNLLVQMREQLVTDNRKKFQKVAKNPASFSQMQIQAYLKTVAFRRDINQVQKAAAGKGIGGIPSARIASEVDREYIFFEPEQHATEADKGKTHNTSLIYQDNLHAPGSKESQERSSERVDIDKSVTTAERISLQKSSPKDNSLEDKDIEWEDGDEVVSLTSQPVKGAVITIEIDQNDLLAEGIKVQKLCPDIGSEDEDIEWEDEAIDCVSGIERQDAPMSNGDHMVDSDIGTGFLASNGMSADSPEIVDKTLMEIEAAELEEAIRQSLEDHTGHKAPKLVIRDESTIELKQNELLSPDNTVTEALLSEEAFLARERERKGKAIVNEYQAVHSGNRVTGEGGTLTLKVNDLEQVSGLDSRYAESCKPLISESENALPSTGHVRDRLSQAHANDLTTNSLHSESCKPPMSITDIGTLSEGHTSVICDGTFHANNHITNVAKAEGECVVNVKANICKSVEVPNELKVNTELSSLSPSFLNSELVGKGMISSQEKLQANRVLTSVDNSKGVDANTDVMEHEKPSTITRNYAGASVIGNNTAAEDDHLQEILLKEAEEVDLNAEQEAFAKQERSLLAEREELSRQQAELQAEMEAEQAAMQADLQEERDLLLQEEIELRATQRKNERNAESVTGEMFSECQELLQMFGLPYIIAPMEAEAQCAYMDSIGLVDGVVTEDCDVFLFGGRNVFKNIFDDRKYVETYYMKDVENELGLNQEKLIYMALLLGSDYTEGISGIGIVNAIEVVNAFEGEAGLQKFKNWLDAPDLTLLNKVHHHGQKKQTKKNRGERESEAEDKSGAEEPDDSAKEGSQTAEYNHRQQDFMHKHRAVSKNWNVPENFPNPVVINAYISPQVDKSTESFKWGRPDLEALRRSCLERFGWNKSKSDELLLPVLKEYDRHETQLRLEAFYTFNQRFAKIRSKRIQKAVSRGTGRLSSELVDFPKVDDSEESSPTRRKAKDSKHKDDACREPEPAIKACSKKTTGLKRRKNEATQGAEVVQEVATRGRARGRGRTASSRGRATASKRSDPGLSTEASLSDEGSSEEMLDMDNEENMDGVHETVPRRSSRLPQRMVYNFSGSEDDSDSGLGASLEGGGSPGYAGSIPPSEVKEPRKSAVPRVEEPNLNKDGEEIGEGSSVVDVIGHQYGFQGETDEDYMVMGGGFCTADDDINQEQSRKPLELAKENDVSEGNACPDTLFVGSNALKAEFSNSETASHISGVEPRLHAAPFLRRKKRRAG